MQPSKPLSVAINGDGGVSITAARAAWLRGDFEACLQHLGALSNCGENPEALLLYARALLRTERAAEVVRVLGDSFAMFEDRDESCTAQMLYASAVARSDPARGLALLAEVSTNAEAKSAHRTIRAEIEYYRGLALWQTGDLEGATRHVLIAERAHADVISVRATQLRGFIAIARCEYAAALKLFREALSAYHECREHDGDVAARIELQIASLELTLLSAKTPGSHTNSEARRITNGSFQSAVATAIRMQTAALDAWLYAHDGNADRATELMQVAEDLAPTPAWHAWALTGRAAIASAFGETSSARAHARTAKKIADRVDWDSTVGEERVGLLLLAEVLAVVQPADAEECLARYDALTSRMDPLSVLQGDPRLAALCDHVRGLVCRSRGDNAGARERLRSAYNTFRRCGNLWRSALALVELDATPSLCRHDNERPGDHFYLEAAAVIVRTHFPRSFLARRIGRWSNVYQDSIATSLTPAQREVLRHLLAGKVPKEIAALTRRKYSTVRNHVAALLAAFDVHGMPELLVVCYERGLGAPSWVSDEGESSTALAAGTPAELRAVNEPYLRSP